MNVVTHSKDGTAFFVKPEECIGVEVIGVKLQRKLPAMTKTERAILGHGLRAGPMQFSPRQASRFVEVEMKYIRTVGKATPSERWALEHGFLTVEELHQRQLAAKRFSAKKIKKFITAAGPDRVLAVYDEMTAPATNGATVPTSNGHNQALPPAANDSNDVPDLWGKPPPAPD